MSKNTRKNRKNKTSTNTVKKPYQSAIRLDTGEFFIDGALYCPTCARKKFGIK